MAEPGPRMGRRMGTLLMIGLLLFGFAFDFVLLSITYLVLGAIVPDALGAVAGSPARFAAWIALVKLPVTLVHLLAATWRPWMTLAKTGELPDAPALRGRRRILIKVRDWTIDVASTAMAALIVFGRVADPGDAHLWLLVAVTTAAPHLLTGPVTGLFWLLGRWWRGRQTYQARHASPDAPHAGPDAPLAAPAQPEDRAGA